jgi:hypothetical protein
MIERKMNMSLIRKKGSNKTVINVAILDLRNYTPSALGKINMINCATVILPTNPTDEFMEAYAGIKVKNIATTISLDKEVKISFLDGIDDLQKNNVDNNTVYIVSGVTAIRIPYSEKPLRVISSGVVIYEKDANVDFIYQSGVAVSVDFTIEHIKSFPNKATIDNNFIEILKENTVVLCGNKLTFANDVNADTLLSKNLFFVSGNEIISSKEIYSVIQSISTVGNRYI